MDFELSEEHKMFKATIRDFMENEVAPLVKDAEEKEEIPREVIRKMGSLGYLGPNFAEEHGGGGMGMIASCIAVEEISRVWGSLSSLFLITAGEGCLPIYAHGSEDQKRKYLIPTMKGEKIVSCGWTEPNAGSDLTMIETRAVKDGDSYVINGTKTFNSFSVVADYDVILAYTDKSKGARGGMSFLIVDKGNPGWKVRKIHHLGLRAICSGESSFEDCRVPADNLVGEEGKGFYYMVESAVDTRITHAARSVGLAQAAYEASLNYVKERVQFGQPIGRFQATGFKVARMTMDIEAARCLVYYTAWLYEKGQRCTKEASYAKLFASEVAQRVTSDALQIHGATGFDTECPVERYFRDAREATIGEGTSELQMRIICKELGIQ
jgi:alkylation response protein AidB-like acyl-CoA dehydrogenase